MLVLDIEPAAVRREWWWYSNHSACGKVSSASSLLWLCLLTYMLHNSTSRLMVLNVSHNDTNSWTHFVRSSIVRSWGSTSIWTCMYVYISISVLCIYIQSHTCLWIALCIGLVLAETCLAQWLTLHDMYGPASFIQENGLSYGTYTNMFVCCNRNMWYELVIKSLHMYLVCGSLSKHPVSLVLYHNGDRVHWVWRMVLVG